jgi:hypothetical protein
MLCAHPPLTCVSHAMCSGPNSLSSLLNIQATPDGLSGPKPLLAHASNSHAARAKQGRTPTEGRCPQIRENAAGQASVPRLATTGVLPISTQPSETQGSVNSLHPFSPEGITYQHTSKNMHKNRNHSHTCSSCLRRLSEALSLPARGGGT